MLFATIDAISYILRVGKYGDNKKSPMGCGFHECISEEALTLLKPGDLIFLCTYNNLLAWVIMYFTSINITHVSLYVGNGEILHSTLSGVRQEKVEVLFGINSRLLPCHMTKLNLNQGNVTASSKKFVGMPYGWRTIFKKALLIVTARYKKFVNWKLTVDIVILLLFVGVVFKYLFHSLILFYTIPAYLIIIAINRILVRIKPVFINEDTILPYHFYNYVIPKLGGIFLLEKR
ncbi:MAG: hypothetical protein ABSE81_02785 [Candidatus Omnitrophota bacterium]|jgi:hypothetical protein